MDIGAQLATAIEAYLARRYAESRRIAAAILEIEDTNCRALNLLGMSLHQLGRADEGLRFVAKAVEVCPDYAAAHNNLATIQRERGDFSAALACIDRAIELDATSADFHLARASLLIDSGNFSLAVESLQHCLTLDPLSAEAQVGLGDALAGLSRFSEALNHYDRALSLNPARVEAHNNRGNVLRSLQRREEAIASFDRALALRPADCEILSNRGNVLRDLQRPAQALSDYDRALAIKPDHAQTYNNRGNALRDLGRLAEALASIDRALELKPDFPEAHNNRGILLGEIGRPVDALASFDRALALKPDYAEALNNRGIWLGEMKQGEAALASFDAAIVLKADYAEAWSNRGNTLRELKRAEDALASFDCAVASKPDFAAAHYGRGHALRDLRRYAEAVAAYARVVALEPDYSFANGHLLHAKMLCCDWTGLVELAATVRADIRAGKKSAEPFGYQGIGEDVQDLRACAEIYAAAMYPGLQAPADFGQRVAGEKIRIGYVSGEFRQQATSVLMAQLWELHDRSRFEIFAFDNGWDDGSEIRQRINRAFAEIINISSSSDIDAVAAIRARKIDILVNLNGYFGLQRQGIFSRRASPLQVNYLGFPGTLGAGYMDYILADSCVIPTEEHQAYAEKVVYLPDTYQVNDTRRLIAADFPARRDCGLPEHGFVFCCFNNNYKITPEIFAIWMRLLACIEGSILWLLQDNADAVRNLRAEAARCGVSPDRLIFAPRMQAPDHLARHRLADLFLDTLPYNAHTTASDALWAGLPVLTCRGTTFPGRVAASLLEAAGVPELITVSLTEYEQRARQLATDSSRLAELRKKLAHNRDCCALFDTKRFCRNIETAYATMWQLYLSGQAPQSFTGHS